jgi:superfamily II DNA/RNA helicase
LDGAQILITTPAYFKNKLEGRRDKLDLAQLKMLVFDEADELMIQETTVKNLDIVFRSLTKSGCTWQSVLFSATYNDVVIERIKQNIGETEIFAIQKESLKLKGVKNF